MGHHRCCPGKIMVVWRKDCGGLTIAQSLGRSTSRIDTRCNGRKGAACKENLATANQFSAKTTGSTRL